MKKRAPKVKTQEEVLAFLRSLKPRYILRVPMRCKHDPCLYEKNGEESIAGRITHVSDSTFRQLRRKGLLKLRKTVNTSNHAYTEYTLASKKKKRRVRLKKRKKK